MDDNKRGGIRRLNMGKQMVFVAWQDICMFLFLLLFWVCLLSKMNTITPHGFSYDWIFVFVIAGTGDIHQHLDGPRAGEARGDGGGDLC